MSAFDKIAGYVKEKEELLSLVKIFNNKERYEAKGASIPRGVIFYGVPGTGKTLFAEVLEEECQANKIHIRVSDDTNEKNICRQIRHAYEKAAKTEGLTLIFFDEMDKFLPNDRERYFTDQSKAVLSLISSLLDGMDKTDNAVLIATCNDYYELPENITRPGRFDKKIFFGIPDYASRVSILNLYMNKTPVRFGMTAEGIAKITEGLTPAALKAFVNNCLLESDENNFVGEELIRKTILGIKEEGVPETRSELSYNVDAVRNIGSFIVARLYSNSGYVLDIEATGVQNRFLDSLITDAEYDEYDDDYYEDDEREESEPSESESYSVFSTNDYLAAISAVYGGCSAEEIVFGKLYNNLEDGLASIDGILIKMASIGMLGISCFYSDAMKNTIGYPKAYKQMLYEEYQRVKNECYLRAKSIIVANEALIRRLVPILLAKKSIEKPECEKIIESLGGITPID